MTQKSKDPCDRCNLSLLLESVGMLAVLGIVIVATIMPLLRG